AVSVCLAGVGRWCCETYWYAKKASTAATSACSRRNIGQYLGSFVIARAKLRASRLAGTGTDAESRTGARNGMAAFVRAVFAMGSAVGPAITRLVAAEIAAECRAL